MELDGKKFLILKLRYIGDTLSLVPVIDNFRMHCPGVLLDVMVNQGTEELLSHHPGIRKLWVYDYQAAKGGVLSSLSYHFHLLRKLIRESYDTVIDFSHGDRAALLSFMTVAPVRITYEDSSSISRLLMNRIIRSNPHKQHIVDYQLQVLKYYGVHQFDRSVRIHIPKEIISGMSGLLASLRIKKHRHVVIHPGARGRLRQWDPKRFAEIALRLRDRFGAQITLVGGPGEEGLIAEVEKRMGFSPSFSSCSLRLLEMAALFQNARLFVGNDSAPGHIAAGAGCQTVSLFGPTFPHMWRPLSPGGVVLLKDVPCRGCRQETCSQPQNWCMDLITVDEVWEKIEAILAHRNEGRVDSRRS